MENIDFKETQRFKIWWAWAAVAALNLLFIYAVFQQVLLGNPFGTKPASNGVLIFIEIILLVFLIFLFSIKLKTRVNNKGIYYRFYPFQFNETLIEWHELKDAYIRQYNSFHEYGGWGIRKGTENRGRAINTSASSGKGLQLQFTDGRLLLIGTRRAAELEKIIDTVMASGNINKNV